jgi:6-phosphofructokinase 1
MAYCRDLGNGAVRLLLDQKMDLSAGVMVTIQSGNIVPMSFAEMVDPRTNRTRIRTVDITSDAYQVARAYMIRLETQDLDDPIQLAKLATAAKMTEADFKKKFTRAATRRHASSSRPTSA